MSGKRVLGFVLMAMLLAMAVLFAHGTDTDLSSRLLVPSVEHPFGTDSFGRDLLARTSGGFLVSFLLSLCVTASATVAGVALSVAMVRDGWIGILSRGLSDMLKSLPAVLFSLFLVALFGQGVDILYLSMTLSQIPNIARTSQARLLVLEKEEFMLALRAEGIRGRRIVLRHYVPHIYPEIANQSISIFSTSILTEASLSFLGCGLPVDIPSLGSIMAEGRSFLFTSPFLFFFPAAILFLAGLALYLQSDPSSHRPD